MNKQVSSLNPKANPVLYAVLGPLIARFGLRYGFNLDEAAFDDVIAAIMVVTAFYARHRVKPVHSNGEDVKLK